MHRRQALLLGLLLLVATGVLLLTRGDEETGTGDTVTRNADEAAAAPARLEGRPDEAPSAPAETPVTSESSEVAAVRVEIRGAVRIADPDASVQIWAWRPTSRLESLDHPGTATRREGPGAYRLDVTDLVQFMQERGQQAEITVRPLADGYVGTRVQVALPALDDLLAGRATIDPVDLVLERAALVSGHVVGEGGEPVDGAEVALFLLTPDGPEPEAVADWASDAEGRFNLAVARSGRYLLTASWLALDETGRMTARPLPASTVVDLVVGETREDIELRLRTSYAIRGTVRVDDRPAAGARVDWHLGGDARPLRDRGDSRFGYSWLWYVDGSVHWARDPVKTDARGGFEILGASTAPYRVFVDSVAGAHLHRMSKEKAEVAVTPPAEVTLSLTLARLVLHLPRDGRPGVPEGGVRLSATGMHPELPDEVCWNTSVHEWDAGGRIEVGVTPGHTYVVVVEEPGYEPWWKQLEAPSAGETIRLTAELERERTKPRLVAVLEGEGAEDLALVTFGFYEPDVDPRSRTPWPIRAATPVEGRFLVEDLIPGPHRVHVRPGRGWYDVPGDWLEAVFEVDIPATGEVEVTVPLARGGRLLIEVTDVDGRHLACPCTIRGPDGVAIETYFVVFGEDTGGVISGELPGIGPAWVNRTLAAGTYEVTLEPEGYAREVRTVEVRVGAPTTLRVTLRKP